MKGVVERDAQLSTDGAVSQEKREAALRRAWAARN